MLTDLLDIQQRNGWPDEEMARRMGLSRSHWNLIRNGRKPLTDATAVRAVGAFPELTRHLLDRATVSVSTPANTGTEAA